MAVPGEVQATAHHPLAERHDIVKLHLLIVVEVLARLPGDIDADLLHGGYRQRIQRTGIDSCTVCLKAVAALDSQKTLGHLRAVGVALTQEQHSNGLVHTGYLRLFLVKDPCFKWRRDGCSPAGSRNPAPVAAWHG
ncbi:hypothetical protein D3C78_1538920 [compost metagenome]